MSTIRGEDPISILELVREVERDSTVISRHVDCLKPRQRRAVYLQNSNWLKVGKETEKRLGLPAWRSTIRLLLKGRVRSAALKLYAPYKVIATTDIVATWVKVKNNVLVLYPDIGLACKIRRPTSARDAESLYNEYGVLKEVASFTGLSAPEPIAYRSEPAPALWLKYVDGRTVKGKEKASIAFRIAESLFAWYEHSGVEIVPSSMFTPLVQALSRGGDGLQEQGWSAVDAAVIHAALKNAADSGIPLVNSQIHGDASTGNAMISPQGSLILIDWETSRRDLVAHDMRKLIATNPKIEQRYFEWLATQMSVADANPKRELALTIALSGADLNKQRHYYSHVTGYTKQGSEARLQVIRRQVLDACATLCH